MPTIKDTAATSALNEDKYINKLYGDSGAAQKDMLTGNLAQNNAALDSAKQQVQQQTQTHLARTRVEANLMGKNFQTRTMSQGAGQQAALSQWGQRRTDINALEGKQANADYEIERQRKLLGEQYASAIKQAQANNDMEKAQALYDAAKAEENQLLELRKQGATLLSGKGDRSAMDALANGELPKRDTTGESWAEVLQNEGAVNQIYDAKQQAAEAAAQSQYAKAISDLEAQRRAQQQQTDGSLTGAYVDALRNAMNYQEVQGAYGQGSGTAAQAALARDAALQQKLTELRGVQAAADATSGMAGVQARADYGKGIADSLESVNSERNKALFDAASKEQQKLVDLQKFVGDDLAKKKRDYTMLGKLYGLTDEQIGKLNAHGSPGTSKSWQRFLRDQAKKGKLGKKNDGGGSYSVSEKDIMG